MTPDQNEGRTLSLHDFLQSTELFRDMDENVLQALVAVSALRRFAAREEILREGALGGSLRLVRSGEVRISKQVPSGGEEALAVLGPGEFFGEVELFDGGPASAHAIAHTACELLSIPHEELKRLIGTRPDLNEALLWAFCRTAARRLREANERLASLLSISRDF